MPFLPLPFKVKMVYNFFITHVGARYAYFVRQQTAYF